ncbi:MAG TPA: DeoR/GlpR family DNA-binding transcription regulator [Anaerolineae bacterium]|nr:DeoR/GlpR family DNA-binding transcription regulator [Anaerolineae bacterium]
MSIEISAPERQQRLLRFIEQQQRITVNQIVEYFDVSLATARRDLETLADQGKVQRVHGGAIAVRQAAAEPPVLQRAAEQSSEKVRIGQAAADLIADGETVFLSTGTTVLEVARRLRGKRNLTVITNSLLVLNELADAHDISIICLGGILRHSEMSLLGHITELALSELRADKVILGIRAIDAEQGLTSAYLPETMTDRAILKIGREVIVVADHTKCAAVSTAVVAPAASIHTLITDTGTPQDFIAAVRAQGVKVMAV